MQSSAKMLSIENCYVESKSNPHMLNHMLHVYETEDLCYLSGNDSVPCSISVSYKHILIHVIF